MRIRTLFLVFLLITVVSDSRISSQNLLDLELGKSYLLDEVFVNVQDKTIEAQFLIRIDNVSKFSNSYCFSEVIIIRDVNDGNLAWFRFESRNTYYFAEIHLRNFQEIKTAGCK